MEQTSAPSSRAFPVLLILLGVCVAMELLLAAIFMDNPRARAAWTVRAALPFVTGLGLLLYSQIVRYVGGTLLFAMGLHSLWTFLPGPPRADVPLVAILVVGAISQTLSGLGLLFWRTFSTDFGERRNRASPWIAKVRLALLVALGIVLGVPLVNDAMYLVHL